VDAPQLVDPAARETGPYAPRHLKLAFDEFAYGHTYRRVTEDAARMIALDRRPRVPLAQRALHRQPLRVARADRRREHAERHVALQPRSDRARALRAGDDPDWHGPIKDALTGKWVTSHVMNQDFVAWLGQGAIADRTKEHLGTSDRGVIMIRKRYVDDMDAMARGEDPKRRARPRGQPPHRSADRQQTLVHRRRPADQYVNRVNSAVARSYIFQVGSPTTCAALGRRDGFEREEPTGGVLELLSATRRA